MNGLQSLMQGAPTQPQPTQAPAMSAQNNPQMAAAMDVVDNDLDKLNLDPRTKALLKTQEAFDLVQSAQRELAMSQPQPMPPTIEGQRQMQTMDGIAGILQSLRPGMQQRGQQVQRQQARQMLGGGMPSMGAPNMARMADGGIVGYQDGGDVESKSMQVPTTINENQRRAPYLDPAVEKFLVELEALNAQKDSAFPQEKDLFEQKIQDLISITSPRVLRIASDSAFGLPKKSGMAKGGIVGYQPGGQVEYDYMSDPNLYAPTQVEEPDADILRFAMERMGRDPEAEALAAGQRLRELTGAEDLMKRREEAASKLEAQRASRFSPEMERKRLLRQGLAGLAEKGLGGFGAGYTAEEERIAGEKLSAAEASVADMDKLIGDLRELGLSQFEAEKQARDMVERGVDQGLSSAQAVLASRRQAETARMQSETTRRGQDIQAATSRAVAEIQTSGSQFGRSLGIRIEELRRNNPDLSQTEIESKALNSLVDDELRAQLARIGVSQADQVRKEINDSITAATEMLTTGIGGFTLSPQELQTQIFDLAKKIRDDLYGSEASTSTRTNAPAVGTISGGYRFKGGDPNDQNNWEKI